MGTSPKNPERLFEFARGQDRFRCELRHDETGSVDAQFFRNDEFLFSRRFADLELAMRWAAEQRTRMKEDDV